MKQFLLAVLLVFVFVASALAGDIPTVNAPTPPPTGPNGMTSTGQTLNGEIPSGGLEDQLSNEALSALLTALVSVID